MQFHYIPSVLEFDNTAFRDVISHLLRQRVREKQVNVVSTTSGFINRHYMIMLK